MLINALQQNISEHYFFVRSFFRLKAFLDIALSVHVDKCMK